MCPNALPGEGVLLLNSFKWDWPTIYGSILKYQGEPLVDYNAPDVTDIMLTDVNSFINIERAEPSYIATDYEVPDERKLIAMRRSVDKEKLGAVSAVLDRRFDWGGDL